MGSVIVAEGEGCALVCLCCRILLCAAAAAAFCTVCWVECCSIDDAWDPDGLPGHTVWPCSLLVGTFAPSWGSSSSSSRGCGCRLPVLIRQSGFVSVCGSAVK
jgi:hypothetical protein